MSEADTGASPILVDLQHAEAACNLLTVLPSDISIPSTVDAKQYIKQKHWSQEFKTEWKRERRQIWSNRNKEKLAESKRKIRHTNQQKLQTLKLAIQCPCCTINPCSEHAILKATTFGKRGRPIKKAKTDSSIISTADKV